MQEMKEEHDEEIAIVNRKIAEMEQELEQRLVAHDEELKTLEETIK